MKIESSTIAMSSQHSLVEEEFRHETLRYWNGNPPPAALTIGPAQSVDFSAQAKALLSRQAGAADKAAQDEFAIELSEEDKRKLELISKFCEMLTGKKIKFVIPRIKLNAPAACLRPGLAAGQTAQGRALQGWGLDYQFHWTRSEQEKMTFTATGSVKTADGREINFTAQLSMTRQFMAEQHISIKAGDALLDPLVINFDAPAARLTAAKYSFDIDADGDAEQVSFAAPGSGFLALDLNGDGIINNGKELFGPNTGNGFAELAQYDADGNNWIDENDAIYDRLRIWTKDANGNDQLFAIGQKGIGAIYLGNVSTEFSHKSLQDNSLQGQLRRTGVFLRENGTTGIMQQVDLAV
ncbi:MAG: hypothetical protein N2491_04665 [Negativicutes bacterium]|nr:hypothetical protein [Negativicutes bacterium]